ncbi:sigma-70 family RNA polymerase sigma factor [Virgibacillus halodenitrificans]|uniref:sigma-70 family RNA polymerase sigma factor n=1 Tax=Virgibacillus halodenitrificans TaxID=1482 RepID=UPI00136E9AC1|nr:sigma-70 family RNA polymerase sigma factor [Virgibacillus halodenitrificans]MYL44606.1 sigma-70 family RNA polymerase sigma factor [Virgibacillus halodenitrificans]
MGMWADKLIGEYEVGRKGLTTMKSELNPEIVEDKQDRKQINSMINDMSYSIEWMKKGRRPGNLRGIDRRSAYQRQVLVDVDLFPSLDIEPEEREIHEEEKRALYNIILDLSHRERQCFLLYQAQGFSMQEIADELNIKKPTVQKFIDRAKNKIKRKLSCHTNVI